MPMTGLTMKSLGRHPALVPLFVILGLGMGLSGGYLLRLAVKSPDVCWDKKNNPTPWEGYANKKYKFYTTEENKKLGDPRPRIDWE